MKFLLVAINAKYIHSNPAIYSLRAYAGKVLGRYVELAEYTINQPMQEILADIYKRRPDYIGFSCYIWNWRLTEELLEEVPKLMPHIEIWLGGPEVSYDAGVVLRKHPRLAGIMVGEGEETFKELLEYYVRRREATAESRKGKAAEAAVAESAEGRAAEATNSRAAEAARSGAGQLEAVGGLCLAGGYTGSRPPMDLNKIPFLYEELSPFENKIIYYESSRGCPYQCSYCLSSLEKRVRLRDIGVIKRELQFFLDYRVKQVKFVDRTFNCEPGHTMQIWMYLKEHDNGVTNFHFEISADILRENEIALLSRLRPGLVQLEIGVQSTNPKTLEAVRRVTDMERLERAVAAVRRGRNVHLHLDLIAGLPFEGYESFRRSFDRVYAMEPDQLQLGFLKLLKGSRLWEKAEEYGICCMDRPPYEVLYTRWLSYEEVLRLKRIEEVVELYYNSGQFNHTMPFLELAFSGPFAMYEALADFYEREGYFVSSPARARRYEALFAFARECDGGRLETYRALLTFDLYLREKVKSRPDFAEDMSVYRDWVRGFYQEEESERRYLPDYGDYDWKQLIRMTHLEAFAYPVWDKDKMAAGYETFGREEFRTRERRYVLFDYRKRNPLNGEAVWTVVQDILG